MKDCFTVRIPYCKKTFFNDKYSLNDDDIFSLKKAARDEGRSLRVFIAYKLKEIAKDNIAFAPVTKK